MPKYTSITNAITENGHLFCSSSHCSSKRIGLSSFCINHRNKYVLYGHPLQYKLHASRHAVEREEVTRIFDNNPQHKGILEAIQFVQRWINAVNREDSSAIAPEEIRRLTNAGVTARDIVIEAASFYIYQQWNKHHFHNDMAVDIALSLAVLGLAPIAKKTRVNPNGSITRTPISFKASARKKIGRYLRGHLIELFHNLQTLIENNQNAAQTVKEAMRSPLTYPAVIIPSKEATYSPPWDTSPGAPMKVF